jgi:hypothetical protein
MCEAMAGKRDKSRIKGGATLYGRESGDFLFW